MTLTASPATATEPQPALIRVLLADDSAAIRTLARYALTPARGFDVVAEARDGGEAIRLFADAQPDCVVLDIEMPGVGGFEALDELRRRAPDLPVVMLSGFSDHTQTALAASRGAAAYLEKSTQLAILGDTVRRVTDAAGRAAHNHEGPEQEAPEQAAPQPAPEPQPEPPAEAARTPEAAPAEAAELRRLEYVISHDFAEPLRIVGGFASLLSNRYASVLDSSGQAFLGQILDGTTRMQTMIDDLLVYARAGRSEPQPGPLDLAALASEAVTELSGLRESGGAQVIVGELPPATGDAAMVKAVLVALIENALLFNRSTPPLVRIEGHLEDAVAAVTVSDNGIGIDPSLSEEVFALFRRLNTREEFPGTGTGLALCRRLVATMSGAISLRSTPGVGTTVTLTLPIHPHPGDRP